MFDTSIRLFVSLLVPVVTGCAFVKIIFKRIKLPLFVFLALAYGLGMGILTQWMLFLASFQIQYNLIVIGLPLIIFSCFCAISLYKNRKEIYFDSKSKEPLSIFWPFVKRPLNILHIGFLIVASLYIIYQVYYVFWRALNIPIYSWDALWYIAFKAKVFFFENSLFALHGHPHPAYPLHVPLMETWIAFGLGKWDEQLIKCIFPLFFLSFVIIHNHFLRYYTDGKWALLGTMLLVSSNLFIRHATISYTEFSVLFYACIAIMLLILWFSKKEDAYLILSSFYAGFATFAKLEGMYYLIIATILFFSILLYAKRLSLIEKFKKIFIFLIPSYGICLYYHFYKVVAKIPMTERMHLDLTSANMNRIAVILHSFWENLFLTGNWNIIWFLLAISLLINMPKIKKVAEIRLLLGALFMFFGLWFTAGLLTINFESIAGTKSIVVFSRLLLHFFPLSILLVILLNYPGKIADHS